MNRPIDRFLLALNLSNPYKSNKDKTKETIKFRIEDLQVSDYHKANMKAIIQQAETIDEVLNNLGSYFLVNSLFI